MSADQVQSGRNEPATADEPATTNERFTQAERVRKRADYQRIYDRGVKVNSRAFTLFRLPNGLQHGRLGIAATRKLGGAVVRNRAKRLVRELFRRNKLAPGFDIVVVPRRELLETSLIALEREFRNSLERSAKRPARSSGRS
jgi:ribonuclease P protein component